MKDKNKTIASTTRRIDDITLQKSRAAQKGSIADLQPGQIILHVASHPNTPIIIEKSYRIVLGRSTSAVLSPIVDLTPYNAHKAGVSRQHAGIRYTIDGFVLEDLSSVNGTWLNGKKLVPYIPEPLKSGDQIQLGKLSLSIYFRDPSSASTDSPPPS